VKAKKGSTKKLKTEGDGKKIGQGKAVLKGLPWSGEALLRRLCFCFSLI
jgi:hypothetical protein